MPRYIDVENIPKLFNKKYNETKKIISDGDYFLDNLAEGFTEADRIIRNMPTADVVEVRRGKWIDLHDEDVLYEQTYKCSVCGECFVLETGTPQENEYNYCPHCGAKMDGKENSK